MSGHVALRTPAWANRPTVERDPALAWLYATGPVNLRDPGTRQSAPNDVNMPGIEHEDLVMPRLRDWLEQQDPKLSLKAGHQVDRHDTPPIAAVRGCLPLQ